MAPANEFVEDFVGADRALKRLSLMRVGDVNLWRAPNAKPGQSTAEVRAELAHPDVEVPYALPTIMEGVTQTLMLSLSMIVIAALVGAGGLGAPVVRALNTVNIAQGFEAGLCIVILAILLDRAFRYRTQHERR